VVKTLARDAKVEVLRAIFAEDIPALPDDWRPPPEVEALPVVRPTVRITGLGGSTVEVDAEDLAALAQDAGGGFASDVSAEEFGRLVYAAKMLGSPLLVPLLQARASTPLYRFRTNDGRPWRPSIPTAVEPEHPAGATP
jgi:hypothetical protein